MDTKDAISLASSLIALLSIISVATFAWINYRRERLNQRIHYANLRQQHFLALRAWSDQISDLLSEVIHFCELDTEKCPSGSFFERRNKYRIALSSMIDHGRWFFPNLHTESHGQDKELAFRGYRQDVLNSLVDAYNSVTGLNYVTRSRNDDLKKRIVTAKKGL
ncbi:hypothetical protein [Burkholderia ubonensis]|uniref:hypothetical protein n=1 Tax=Burkholderia ubonensis TaxID=101571 RepID=UPI001E543176|nr:hypothetical protein [Burkholderia ubonensis]